MSTPILSWRATSSGRSDVQGCTNGAGRMDAPERPPLRKGRHALDTLRGPSVY